MVAENLQLMSTRDPLRVAYILWPDVTFYKEQEDIIRSVWESDETYVIAGNMLGKDFIAGFMVLAFFLTRTPCKIVTTSVEGKHLINLWGEVDKFIRTSRVPLLASQGGCLHYNNGAMEIWRVENEAKRTDCYAIGRTVSRGESFSGAHVAQTGDGIPRTLFMADEASACDSGHYEKASTWANRMYIFGNPWECNNFFKWAYLGKPGSKDKGGDIPRENGKGFYRRVFNLKAIDSPNVKLGLMEIEHGLEPSNRIVVPGVKPWAEYAKNRKLWDPIRQCVGLDAQFPKDERVKMFPADWIERAAEIAHKGGYGSQAEGMGVDSAEGGDNSVIVASSRKAAIEMLSLKTPDTSVIPDEVVKFLSRHTGIRPEKVFFDQGGGGKEHVDRMRKWGHDVRVVHFGSAATPELVPGVTTFEDKVQNQEKRAAYKNKRAEMYCVLRRWLNPANGLDFAIPAEMLDRQRSDGRATLREQMAAIPLEYDREGRIFVIPKNKRDREDKQECLSDIIGCSPDELDALVLSVYAIEAEEAWSTVGIGY